MHDFFCCCMNWMRIIKVKLPCLGQESCLAKLGFQVMHCKLTLYSSQNFNSEFCHMFLWQHKKSLLYMLIKRGQKMVFIMLKCNETKYAKDAIFFFLILLENIDTKAERGCTGSHNCNYNINKPAAQTAGADPSRCNSTNRQKPTLQ